MHWVSMNHPDPLSERTVTVDFETTGLDVRSARVVSVGAAVFEHGCLVERWEALVNPQDRELLRSEDAAEALEIHRLAPDRIEVASQTWPDAAKRLAQVTENALVVCQRLGYDARVWAAECERHGLSVPARHAGCSKVLAGALGVSGTGLSDLVGRFGIPLPSLHAAGQRTIRQAHSALSDAEATGGVWYHLVGQAGGHDAAAGLAAERIVNAPAGAVPGLWRPAAGGDWPPDFDHDDADAEAEWYKTAARRHLASAGF